MRHLAVTATLALAVGLASAFPRPEKLPALDPHVEELLDDISLDAERTFSSSIDLKELAGKIAYLQTGDWVDSVMALVEQAGWSSSTKKTDEPATGWGGGWISSLAKGVQATVTDWTPKVVKDSASGAYKYVANGVASMAKTKMHEVVQA
jgi:hypothetical protein